jgi:hypothetical protein
MSAPDPRDRNQEMQILLTPTGPSTHVGSRIPPPTTAEFTSRDESGPFSFLETCGTEVSV